MYHFQSVQHFQENHLALDLFGLVFNYHECLLDLRSLHPPFSTWCQRSLITYLRLLSSLRDYDLLYLQFSFEPPWVVSLAVDLLDHVHRSNAVRGSLVTHHHVSLMDLHCVFKESAIAMRRHDACIALERLEPVQDVEGASCNLMLIGGLTLLNQDFRRVISALPWRSHWSTVSRINKGGLSMNWREKYILINYAWWLNCPRSNEWCVRRFLYWLRLQWERLSHRSIYLR